MSKQQQHLLAQPDKLDRKFVRSCPPPEFGRALACALELGREDFITVLYLGYYLGLTPTECFTMETGAARIACAEGTLNVRGRGKLPLNDILIQRLRRHLTLDSPGRRLLIPDRRWTSRSVEAFQAFLELYYPIFRTSAPPQVIQIRPVLTGLQRYDKDGKE